MVELLSIKDLKTTDKISLLKELGYNSDGMFVLNPAGEKVKDKYIDEPVRIDHMLILPGSTIFLDDNPLSIACYLEEYPNAF